ncbi:2'-5' RNA ligase family protein [Streptomyces sp. NPDC085529]|uniref:2'-5' RNA ligase family protein n=1 Tax=Streptomyces sp. NPDC085529 TaxID=3365729 RepID=UPI0037D5F2A8
MEDFFAKVGRFWPAGRRDLHWHILPTPAEADALIAPYQHLVPPGLQNVGAAGMHCTLLHAIGLGRDDVDIDALVKDAVSRVSTVQPFTLTFDRPAVGSFAIELSGWPGRPFTALVDTVTQATASTGAAFKPGPSRYPHMSTAYTTAGAKHVDPVSLKAALADIDRPLSATVLADRIHLVEQRHDGAHIRREPIAEVPLAGVGA